MQPLLAAASMDGGETRVKGGPFSGNPTPSGPEFIGAPRRQCVERAATVIARPGRGLALEPSPLLGLPECSFASLGHAVESLLARNRCGRPPRSGHSRAH